MVSTLSRWSTDFIVATEGINLRPHFLPVEHGLHSARVDGSPLCPGGARPIDLSAARTLSLHFVPVEHGLLILSVSWTLLSIAKSLHFIPVEHGPDLRAFASTSGANGPIGSRQIHQMSRVRMLQLHTKA